MGAAPDGVELGHDLLDKDSLVGNDAGLEVSPVLAFGAHSGAGQIGAAGVGKSTINNHGLEMNARAENSLHAGDQIRVAVEILAKSRARLFGVQQSDLHMALRQIR